MPILKDLLTTSIFKIHGSDFQLESWMKHSPYFAVLSDAKYKDSKSHANTDDFWISGQEHFISIIEDCRAAGIEIGTLSALDFGCGVGRIAIPLAQYFEQVTGCDSSLSMLDLANRACLERQVGNVSWISEKELLTNCENNCYDFVHSYMVLQHIKPARGLKIISRLLSCLKPKGVILLHVCYRDDRPLKQRLLISLRRSILLEAPQMHMYTYNMHDLLKMLENSGIEIFAERYEHHGLFATLRIYGIRK